MRHLFLLLSLLTAPAFADETAHFVAARPDGGVTVVIAVPKSGLLSLPAGASDEEYAQNIIAQTEACQKFGCEQMPEDWWPPFDDRLRDAWEKLPDVAEAGNFTDMGAPMRGIGINMGKAKGIWKERMGLAALIEAGKLDAEITKADLNGDNQGKAQAQQKRNALNGILNRNQAAIDAAQTPEELMAVWPTEIEARRPRPPTQAKVDEIKDIQRKMGRKD